MSHFVDITARTLAEQRQAQATARFETAFTNAPIGMGLVALDGRWTKVNAALCELTRYAEQELLALTFQAITHPDDRDADQPHVERLLGEIQRYTIEKRYLGPAGRLIWVNLSGSLIRDAAGEPLHFVAHVEDITERKRLAGELQRLADSDPLTNLWNRRRFEEELQRQVGRCRRYDDRSALLMIDLNEFKSINDTYGHRAGDELLQAVANALSTGIRATDAIARLGGNEFVVMLANVSPDQATMLCTKLRAAIAAVRMSVDGEEFGVTASVGMTLLDGDAPDAHAAMARADAAMYEGKAASAGDELA